MNAKISRARRWSPAQFAQTPVELRLGALSVCNEVDGPAVCLSPKGLLGVAMYGLHSNGLALRLAPNGRHARDSSRPSVGAPRSTGGTDNRDAYAGTGDGEWRPPAEVYDVIDGRSETCVDRRRP